MHIHEILGLRRSEAATRWTMTVVPTVLTPAGALHGGSGFGAAIEAMVGTTARPLVWATAQFLTHVSADAVLDAEVRIEIEGRYLTQARCVLRLGEVEILTAHGALGHRSFTPEHVFDQMIDVPPPASCPPRLLYSGSDTLMGCWEVRVARGRTHDQLDGLVGPGRSASWYRLPGSRRLVTAGDLGVVGDFVMIEFSDAIGTKVTGNSLDNTIRVGELVETEWILVDARVHAVMNGFGSATANLWAEDGTLLGVASQTLVMRTAGADDRSVRHGRRIADPS